MSADAVNHFTSNILNHLYASQDATGNIAFSGLCLYILMGTINTGLDGRCYDQLSKLLANGADTSLLESWRTQMAAHKLSILTSYMERYSITNSAMFYSCNLYNQFQEISLESNLKRIKVNYSNPTQVSRDLQDWMKERTYGSIKHTFSESILDENTIILLSTLIYGVNWVDNFESSRTKPEIFTDDKGQKFLVHMMNEERVNLVYDSPNQNFRIHFKTFDNYDVYSAIVLPRNGFRFIDGLRNFKLHKMKAYMKNSEMKHINLKLPKFKIISKNHLNQAFKYYGVTDIFDRYHSDFGMMTNHTVFIESLIQFVRIDIDDVNFGGVATDSTMGVYARQPYQFHVTSPFMFVIYSKLKDMVLINAIVTNPTTS
ncbi:Serpin B7 [Thelohanellus kitauei]|uniref:Serpin B7 n=1 Tax=Thelohanellus kitauei TaxID=669202 RepID=A0A0C2N0R6_THEKT|nr:Serpin B7 [Thelohanellus kitauei]